MPESAITTYGQIYNACEALSAYQWLSILAAFTMAVTGSPAPSEVWLHVLTQASQTNLFTYVTASGQSTTILCLL